MCGIVGIYMRDSPCDPMALSRMRDLLAHRGPDDSGILVEGSVGLAHRRLSIIDLGGGHQPMSTPDGRYTIVYNGEIYNYRELRRQLEADTVPFRTSSDTEVILQLHARHGAAAVAELNGIFAYALWDRVTGRVLLARDRAGIKPLYYAVTASGIAFASEIKALFSSGLVAPRVSEPHIAEYLIFRDIAGSSTLFKGVTVLSPGCVLEIAAGIPTKPRAYWTVSHEPVPFVGCYAAALDTVDAVLREAIGRQLIADVPLGTFCSGGIDSSLVTAIACQLTDAEINTFSVGFDEATYDESDYARLAARASGSRHHEVRISESRFAELLPRLIWHNDLPLNFANSIHIFAVSELARQFVTVVLTGEGADELFGGYPRYSIPRIAQMATRMPAVIRGPLAAMLARVGDHRARKIGSIMDRALHEALILNSTSIQQCTVERLVDRGLVDSSLSVRRRLAEGVVDRHADPYGAVAELDFQTYLVSILNRQDKMSMAAGLEARVPFLDNAVIDLARSLPQAFKQTVRYRKRVLRDVALRYLPAEIVNRRKSGFGVPLPEWFRGKGPVAELLNDVARGDALDGFLDQAGIEALIDEHRRYSDDHSELLWGVLNLGLWLTTYVN